MGQLLSKSLPPLRVDLPASGGRLTALEDAIGPDLANVVWRQTMDLERDSAKAEVRRCLLPKIPRSMFIAEVRYDVGDHGAIVGGEASVRQKGHGEGFVSKLERLTPAFVEKLLERLQGRLFKWVSIAIDSVIVAEVGVFADNVQMAATGSFPLAKSKSFVDRHGRLRVSRGGQDVAATAHLPWASRDRAERLDCDARLAVAYPLYSLLLKSVRSSGLEGGTRRVLRIAEPFVDDAVSAERLAAHLRFLAVGGDRDAFAADALAGRWKFSAAILGALDCADERIRAAI